MIQFDRGVSCGSISRPIGQRLNCRLSARDVNKDQIENLMERLKNTPDRTICSTKTDGPRAAETVSIDKV